MEFLLKLITMDELMNNKDRHAKFTAKLRHTDFLRRLLDTCNELFF